MSRRLIIAFLFLSTSAFAQKQGDLRATLFTTNPSGGVGAALTYWAGERLSLEVSAANESHSDTRIVIFEGDQAREERFTYSSFPIDLLAQYHIPTKTINRWKPYVGGGVRYVKRPDDAPDDTNATFSPELNGGLFYHLSERIAVRLDVRQLLSGDTPPYDDSSKLSFGVAWRF